MQEQLFWLSIYVFLYQNLNKPTGNSKYLNWDIYVFLYQNLNSVMNVNGKIILVNLCISILEFKS